MATDTPLHDDLRDWLMAQYVSAVHISEAEGGAQFNSLIAEFPTDCEMVTKIPMTGLARIYNFTTLKFRYPLGPDGYTCTALVAVLGGLSTHFAYAYWRRGGQLAGTPEYICISPTFDSRDGEYRPRFICGPAFVAACERFADELAPFEAAILGLGGDLELKATTYPEVAVGPTEGTRLPIMAFAVAIALDLWKIRHGILMSHTNTSYVALVSKIGETLPDLLSRGYHAIDAMFTTFMRGHDDPQEVQCGQKLVPMHTRETMLAFDYNLAVWRELAVSRAVSDLVINFVSPSFAIYNQWTFIEGADSTLFENPAMHERYARGSTVAAATEALREARRIVGTAGQNYYTEELSAHMYESLEYAQSYLLMSPVALMHTMEDVGWSMRSLAGYVRRCKNQLPAAVNAFADPDTAARHLFELAYAAHCLHTKAGVAHTDLHGNNMTFYMWGLSAGGSRGEGGVFNYAPYYDDPVVAYVTGPRGEADTYIFPAAGDSACIIDYSRVILGPAFRPRLEEGRSPQYATNFYRDQVNRVMRAFHRYAPDYVTSHQNAIKAAVIANFEVVFPVLCAVDFIAIGASIAAMLEDAAAPTPGEFRPFRVDPSAVALANRLEAAGREMLITGLTELIGPRRGVRAAPASANTKSPAKSNTKSAAKSVAHAPSPGAAVLELVFGDWLFPRWAAREPARVRKAQLVDAYNYNNEIRYSGTDYADYPPWARLDEIERHLGELKLTDVFERGVEPFLATLRPGARIEVIAEQVRAQQEKLDGKPVSTASSWLDE